MVRATVTHHAFLATAILFSALAARPASADSLTVLWDPNAEEVSGYAVYVGTQSGTLTDRYDVGNTTSFTLSNAVSGQQYCFAVAAYFDPAAEGPRSSEVCGFSNQYPTLLNPGNQSSTAGEPVSLQLSGSDPDGQPLSYSATGLPPGLELMPSTGFISGAGTTPGTYSVAASASDGSLVATQSFSWAMAEPPVSDTNAPVVDISDPTSGSDYSTTSSSIALSGTASDDVAVASVDWSNDRGGNGLADGTDYWTTPGIGLQLGTNIVTIEARDGAGNRNTRSLRIERLSETPDLVLSGTSYMRGRWLRVLLAWNDVPGDGILVYRDGVYLTTTSNDGSYQDTIRSSPATLSYQICVSGTVLCSNTIVVSP
jgi:hypothetical protein